MNRSAITEQTALVQIEWAAPYELLASLRAYAGTGEHRVLDLGPSWVRRVRQLLTPALAAAIGSPTFWTHADLLDVLVWRRSGDGSVSDFLRWIAGLTPGDLLELVAPHVTRTSQPTTRCGRVPVSRPGRCVRLA